MEATLRYLGTRAIVRLVEVAMVVATIVAVVVIAASAHRVRPKPADFIGIPPAGSCCTHRTEDIRRGLFWTP
ncbi:MAG: hypothetical protein M3P01_05090 [Actinomycetota bacterium]|nr:hypothetical protein [Actinomycetota bacterium]